MQNLWLVVIILLLLVELISHNIVTIWYAISALLALVIALYSDNFSLQLSVFLILGTVLTIILRPVLNKYLKEKLNKIKRKR